MSKKYFVTYFVCFAERETETFSTWISMRRFLHQLRPGQLLDYGEIAPQATHQEAA